MEEFSDATTRVVLFVVVLAIFGFVLTRKKK